MLGVGATGWVGQTARSDGCVCRDDAPVRRDRPEDPVNTGRRQWHYGKTVRWMTVQQIAAARERVRSHGPPGRHRGLPPRRYDVPADLWLPLTDPDMTAHAHASVYQR